MRYNLVEDKCEGSTFKRNPDKRLSVRVTLSKEIPIEDKPLCFLHKGLVIFNSK